MPQEEGVLAEILPKSIAGVEGPLVLPIELEWGGGRASYRYIFQEEEEGGGGAKSYGIFTLVF